MGRWIAFGLLLALGCGSEVGGGSGGYVLLEEPYQGDSCYAFRESTHQSASDRCPSNACLPREESAAAIDIPDVVMTCPISDGCGLSYDIDGNPKTGPVQFHHGFNGVNTVRLTFAYELLTGGFSLEAFRRYKMSAAGGHAMSYGHIRWKADDFEVLDYKDGVLHFRVTGDITSLTQQYQTPPYWCGVSTFGTQIYCDQRFCDHVPSPGQTPHRFTYEVRTPIEIPARFASKP